MSKVVRLLLILVIALLGALPAAAQDEMMPLLNIGGSDEIGPFLVDAEGRTLYIFNNDTPTVSNCVDGCLANWPPLTVESADELSAAPGINGTLATIERADTGALQVTYNGMPLYYFANDANPGDATGQARGDVWWVVRPETVIVGGNDELGRFLVGGMGMTLYIFTNDEMGVSNCVDGCLANWPPLTVGSEDELVAGKGVDAGMLGIIERADTGALQVTYDGMPLYYWAQDEAVGDAGGQGRGDVWYVVKPTLVMVGSSDELGNFLVGGDGMTLYTWANDAEGVSNCVDGCAVNWPPMTVLSEDDLVLGEGVTGEFGVIERADGSLQVTHDGMPLYFWTRDGVPGDATGQARGDVWFVVAQ